MSLSLVLDVASGACLLGGAFFALVAALGVLRFDNLFSRMHAATKPQVLGLLLILLGVALRIDDWHDIGLLLLVAVFQLMTAPVSAHMLGRAAYRSGYGEVDHLVADESMPDEAVPDDPPR